MPKTPSFRKPVVALLISTLLSGILITQQCRIFNPVENESSVSLELRTLPDSVTGSDSAFFLNDTITVIIDSRNTDRTDSIVCRNSVSDKCHSITRKEITGFDTARFSFDHPCTVTVYAAAWSGDTAVKQVGITLFLDQKPGDNRTPEIRLDPIRRYAAATAPCTISVAFDDPDFWQKMSLSAEEDDQEKITIIDSLVIFTPDVTDTASTIEFSITGTDNGDPPQSDTKKIIITLIEDEELFPPPSEVKVDERSDEAVTISWEGDSLADGYTIYRSPTADNDDWDSVATVDDTTFTDSTDTAYFYRVVTQNCFGGSDPGEVILATDTLHYGHAVSFATDESTVSESASNHSVTLEVSREALIPITVILDTTGEWSDDARITLDTTAVVINEGETSVEVPFTLRDDEEENGSETLTVAIESVSSGFFSGVTEHSVIVTDNDLFHTVTYDDNGADDGDVPEDEERYKRDATVTVLGNSGNLTKDGYTFTGWNTKADGKGSGYVADAEFTMPDKNVTLFAQWTDNPTWKVLYNENESTDGAPPVDGNNYETGGTITVKAPGDLEKTGHAFVEWNTRSDGTGTSYMPDSTLKMGTETITLYAIWEKKRYMIVYNGNGNSSGSVPDTLYARYRDSVTISGNTGDLQKSDFFFDGWNSEEDGNGISYPADTAFRIGAESLLLFTQWRSDSIKFLTSFSFADPEVTGTVNENNHVITITVPHGTDVASLIAVFTFTGAFVSVDGTQQTSGTTVNDFSDPVSYKVTAQDRTYQEYTVTVTAALNPAKELTAFGFVNPAVTGTINENDRTITVTVPYGTALETLVAVFATTGASVTIDGTQQTSGITVNDFSDPVSYRVTAQDGTYQEYTVTVDAALNPAKELTAFGFVDPAVSGIIEESTHAVSVAVPFNTSLTALVATFTTTGVSISIGGTVQTNGSTSNNFQNPVTYRVTAEDGSFQDYVVTVTVEPCITFTVPVSGFSVRQSADSGYIVLGDEYLTKTNSHGVTLETQEVDLDDIVDPNAIIQSEDGNYYYGIRNRITIFKAATDGTDLWSTTCNFRAECTNEPPQPPELMCIYEADDSSVIAGGSLFRCMSSTSPQAIMFKMNADGDSAWTHAAWAPSGGALGNAVCQSIDGVSSLVGSYVAYDAYAYWGFAFQINPDGTVRHSPFIPHAETDTIRNGFNNVWPTSDGGYLGYGGTSGFGNGTELIKTDAEFNYPFTWRKSCSCNWVEETDDGNYIMIGDQLEKLDQDGNTLWSRPHSGEYVKQTSDGGFIIVGTSLIKTDPDGFAE